MRKKFGFTLAEVLITLSIIGIVAAMTVPTLVQNFQKHAFATGLKKAQNTLINVLEMAPVSEGCGRGDFECADLITYNGSWTAPSFNLEKLKQNLKVVQTVTTRPEATSNIEKYYNINNGKKEEITYTQFGAEAFVTADGMLWQFNTGGMVIGNGEHPIIVNVDVNGSKKGPNIFGRDTFTFYIAPNPQNAVAKQGTIIPVGSQLYSKYVTTNNPLVSETANFYWANDGSCNGRNITNSCTARVLEEGAMNY